MRRTIHGHCTEKLMRSVVLISLALRWCVCVVLGNPSWTVLRCRTTMRDSKVFNRVTGHQQILRINNLLENKMWINQSINQSMDWTVGGGGKLGVGFDGGHSDRLLAVPLQVFRVVWARNVTALKHFKIGLGQFSIEDVSVVEHQFLRHVLLAFCAEVRHMDKARPFRHHLAFARGIFQIPPCDFPSALIPLLRKKYSAYSNVP